VEVMICPEKKIETELPTVRQKEMKSVEQTRGLSGQRCEKCRTLTWEFPDESAIKPHIVNLALLSTEKNLLISAGESKSTGTG